MHIVHAGRTRRHAGKAGETPVDVLDYFGGWLPVLLQHLLDEINPAARAIQFIPKQYIGRTGRRAKSAMHTGTQNLVGFRNIGIGELSQAEFGLHATESRFIRPRFKMRFGSKLARTRSLRAASPAG